MINFTATANIFRYLRSTLVCLLAVFAIEQAAAADWQLSPGEFVPAKMPMVLVHPRPDSETNTWARHRKAYPDGVAQYRIPIAIQGGAYPFHFEIGTGPTGMTVGQSYGDADYGIVTWTPTEAMPPQDVSIRITDQEGSTVSAAWTVEATESGFIFIDPNAPGSGNGSKNSPLKTFADLHLGARDEDSFSGNIVYLRAGIHRLEGPEAKGNLQLQNNWKPAVYLGYTGEDVTVNCSSAKILVDRQDDVFVSGFRMHKARDDVNNSHFWFFNQNYPQSRVTFFEMDFDDIQRGLAGNDNPAAITFFNPGALRNYFTLWGVTIENYAAPLVDTYAIKFAVIEDNMLGRGSVESVDNGFLLKSDIQYFSVRRNTSLSQRFWQAAIDFYLQAGVFTNDQLEASYNTILVDNPTSENKSIIHSWTNSPGKNQNPRLYIYRNTVNSRISGLDGISYSAEIVRNVVQYPATLDSSSANRKIIATDNLIGGDLINSNGMLTDAYLRYLGTRGYQIHHSVDRLAPRPPEQLQQAKRSE